MHLHCAIGDHLLPSEASRARGSANALALVINARPDGWGNADHHDHDYGYDHYPQNWIWFGLALWTGLAEPPELTP